MSDRLDFHAMLGIGKNDYTRDHALAQMTRTALQLQGREQALRFENDPAYVPEGAKLQVQDVALERMQSSGLTALVFEQTKPSDVITIAFRGIDSAGDLAPAAVLMRDGSWGKELIGMVSPFTPRSDAERQVAQLSEFLAGKAVPSWHPQFTAALDYVGEVIRRNPGVPVQVTGVGVGGAIAQLAAHTYGLEGRAYEPLGAADLLGSPEYAQWLQSRQITPQGVTPPGDFEYGFLNYHAKRSKVEEYGGESIGPIERFSPAVGRKGVGEWAAYAGGLADGLLSSPVFEVANVLAKPLRGGAKALDMAAVALALTDEASRLAQVDLTNMDRIVEVFDDARTHNKLRTFGATDQPAAGPRLLNDPAHPGHALYSQALDAMQASPQVQTRGFTAEQQQTMAANLVAGMTSLKQDQTDSGLLQERLNRIDTVLMTTDGSRIMAIDGKPDAMLRLRYATPVEQALSGTLAQASQQAEDGLAWQKGHALAAEQERARTPPQGPVLG